MQLSPLFQQLRRLVHARAVRITTRNSVRVWDISASEYGGAVIGALLVVAVLACLSLIHAYVGATNSNYPIRTITGLAVMVMALMGTRKIFLSNGIKHQIILFGAITVLNVLVFLFLEELTPALILGEILGFVTIAGAALFAKAVEKRTKPVKTGFVLIHIYEDSNVPVTPSLYPAVARPPKNC